MKQAYRTVIILSVLLTACGGGGTTTILDNTGVPNQCSYPIAAVVVCPASSVDCTLPADCTEPKN